ncbi:O-antigen ligase family protein [Sporosarcina sp. NPDC096371]|uniref:O-antigen ligase family protein n=1 Tax=Sporosarcina sp. NPDC096371 TaxID=3364530 RepID=UPI00382E9317
MELKHSKIMLALVAFIILQPVIDVLTTASILFIDLPLTVGVLIRLAYLGIMAAWIVYAATKSKRAKLYLLYLVGFAVLVVVNFVTGMMVKKPFFIVEELTFYTKAVYFHVLFFGFLLLIESLAKNGSDTKKQLVNYFLLASGIISAVFVIAQLTGTSLANYARSKEGWTGWFYAGNEIGAAMAILLPITALYATSKTTSLKKSVIIHWLPFIFLSLSMLALGTKVGYGGILIVLLSIICGSVIMLMWKKKDEEKKVLKANALVSGVLIGALALTTPFTPVFGNMFAHLDILGISFKKPPVEYNALGEEIVVPEDEGPKITAKELENLVFSSREQYAADYKVQFADAPLIQQLFGMGFAGNYDHPEPHKPLKMIEMDFHDWFYAFGILGFLYMMAPIIYFAVKYVWQFIRNFKETFNYFGILTGVAFLIGMGISFTAGHVLTAPSVSIYLAFLFAVLVVVSRDTRLEKRV